MTNKAMSSAKVQQAGTTHGPQIAEAIARRVGLALLAAPVQLLIESIVGWLARATTRLVAADDALAAEVGDDAGPRAARDEATAQGTALLVDLRGVIESVYGPLAPKLVGYDGRTPQEADDVDRLLEIVRAGLGRLAGQPTRHGLSVDLALWQTRLDAAAGATKGALGSVVREQREYEAALVARNTAMADYDGTFTLVAGLLSALARLGGEAELADRVRPSARRPGLTLENEDGPAPQPAPMPISA